MRRSHPPISSNFRDAEQGQSIPYTVDSLQIGHLQFGQVLKGWGFPATDAVPPIACGPDGGQLLKAAGLPESGGRPN
jgi:hypothetical protein